VDCAIPACLGGVDGECVYIDTEGSFVPSRARDIASGLLQHVEAVCRRRGQTAAHAGMRSLDALLRGIHVFRLFDASEQLSCISSCLPAFLSAHPAVRLLLIDSIAFHFRRGFESDFSTRARLLSGMAQQLLRLAALHNVAVVAVNQVTTRIADTAQHDSAAAAVSASTSSSSPSSALAPALGESWSHSCTTRVLLFWQGRERWARVLKSPSRRQAACRFAITQQGIRDVKLSAAAQQKRELPDGAQAAEGTGKRSRAE
jgi:RAD51-like protein 2